MSYHFLQSHAFQDDGPCRLKTQYFLMEGLHTCSHYMNMSGAMKNLNGCSTQTILGGSFCGTNSRLYALGFPGQRSQKSVGEVELHRSKTGRQKDPKSAVNEGHMVKNPFKQRNILHTKCYLCADETNLYRVWCRSVHVWPLGTKKRGGEEGQ